MATLKGVAACDTSPALAVTAGQRQSRWHLPRPHSGADPSNDGSLPQGLEPAESGDPRLKRQEWHLLKEIDPAERDMAGLVQVDRRDHAREQRAVEAGADRPVQLQARAF